MILTGTLQKLKGSLRSLNAQQQSVRLEEIKQIQPVQQVEYALPIGQELLPLNTLLGQTLYFDFTGNIFCSHCGKKTKKSYQQGYCYICATTLARCDICIVRPEKCHFHLNTCREPQWGQTHCMIPHIVYLSNTSNLKVGITRETQIPTRWIDQGATQALPIARVLSRYQAGQLEVALGQHVKDKTDWRAMLKGENESIDLCEKYNEIRNRHLEKNIHSEPNLHSESSIYSESKVHSEFNMLSESATEWLNKTSIILQYPIVTYPTKIQSINVEKEPQFSSILQGIKGQYLILEKGVMNMRNLTGYELQLKIPPAPL